MNKITIIHLLHIFLIGPLFLYIGIEKQNIPFWFFPFLLILGIWLIGFHISLGYKNWIKKRGIWVNFLHIFIIGPLLIYIGYKNLKTPRYCFELLLMLGFATIGYHGYYLLTEINQ